jgi:hypothetical protein
MKRWSKSTCLLPRLYVDFADLAVVSHHDDDTSESSAIREIVPGLT